MHIYASLFFIALAVEDITQLEYKKTNEAPDELNDISGAADAAGHDPMWFEVHGLTHKAGMTDVQLLVAFILFR
jgi:hypothetical protein